MNQVTIKWRELGDCAHGIIPNCVGYTQGFEVCRGDIKDFQDDILLLARKADAVLFAYGEHLKSLGVISKDDLKDHFTDTFTNAINGNATYCIEAGIEERLEGLREAAE